MTVKRIENGVSANIYGGSEADIWNQYSEKKGTHYSSDPNHFMRSTFAQPNHEVFFKRLLKTKGSSSVDIDWIRRQILMKRIRKP